MPPRIASLSELLNSLDAATYFFVSSGVFIAVAAVLFFFLGLWLGGLIWAHYKRRFRHAEHAIEAFKGEVALLKRRLAEQSTRPSPTMGPSPLQSIAFRAVTPADIDPSGVRAVPPLPAAQTRAGAPFTVWTEAGWTPAQPHQTSLLEAVRTGTATVPPMIREAHVTVRTATTADLPEWRLLFAPHEVFMVPRSHAFCIWTERTWTPHPIKPAPLPPAKSFALWTQPEFTPACRGPLFPSRAHSLWTAPGWSSSYKSGPPTRSARSFTLWTERDWKLPSNLPLSSAFTLWTEPSWTPSPVKAAQPLPGRGWSVWTSPDFVAASHGVLLPSRAFTLWTEPDGNAVQSALKGHIGKPFTLWTETAEAPAEAAVAAQPVIVAAKRQGFVSRMRAAARRALGLSVSTPPPAMTEAPTVVDSDPSASSSKAIAKAKAQAPVPRSSGAAMAPVVTVKATSAPAANVVPEKDTSMGVTPALSKEVSQAPTPAIPAFSGPLPPSKAFSVWTAGPANKSGKKIKQSVAMAALIESKTGGATAGTEPAHSPAVPPVPVVQSSEDAAATPNAGASLLPPLDVEPLKVPDEKTHH